MEKRNEFALTKVLVSIVLVAIVCPLGALSLKEEVSPFEPGSLTYAEKPFTPDDDGCVMDTTMYFPIEAGSYTPILFLGGFYDWMNTGAYAYILRNLTQHGYIVFGIDRYDPPVHGSNKAPNLDTEHLLDESRIKLGYGDGPNATLIGQMFWLQKHVPGVGEAVKVDWSKLTLACHSASCDETLKIIKKYPHFAAASIFLDPESFQSAIMNPINTTTAALSYMSEKSFSFPQCCIKGSSYKRFYDLMESLAVRMVVKDFGHCDVLNPFFWNTCAKMHVCPHGDPTKVGQYKLFTAGMINAFLRFSLDNDLNMKKYVTDQTFMPLPVKDLAFKQASLK